MDKVFYRQDNDKIYIVFKDVYDLINNPDDIIFACHAWCKNEDNKLTNEHWISINELLETKPIKINECKGCRKDLRDMGYDFLKARNNFPSGLKDLTKNISLLEKMFKMEE